MGAPRIKRVETNKGKGKTYTKLFDKYNLAIENEYYGEAEIIVYAYMEDRLRSFLYYSNLLDNRNSNKINENGIALYGKELDIKNISCKIKIIQTTLDVCKRNYSDLSCFEKDLKRSYVATIKVGEMKSLLKNVLKWCDYRNEIVHGLFNKDLDDLRSGYKQHVEEGYTMARKIDSYVESLKRA